MYTFPIAADWPRSTWSGLRPVPAERRGAGAEVSVAIPPPPAAPARVFAVVGAGAGVGRPVAPVARP